MKKFIARVWNSPNEDRFPGPQPISIERRHFKQLRSRPYVVCEKTDGTRHMLACFTDQDKKLCMLVDRCFNFTYTTLCVPRDTLLDGELIGDEYVVHDAMMVRGENIMHLPLLERLERVKRLMIPKTPGNPKVVVKKMYYLDQVKEIKMRKGVDGLVFTPIDEPVRMGTHETMYKWKPKNLITIDFLVKNGGLFLQHHDYICDMIGYKQEYEGKIVECEYNNGWYVVKVRNDKNFPNNRRTYDRTLVNIREDILITEF